MLVKIHFRTGTWMLLEAGGMFQSAAECRDAFMDLLNGTKDGPPGEFITLTDFRGRKVILNRSNINSVEVDYKKDHDPMLHKPGGNKDRR